MSNIRRFLRYDVTIPFHIEEVDLAGKNKRFTAEDIIDADERERLATLQKDLKAFMDGVENMDSETIYIFHMLHHRINFMGWLLEQLIENEAPENSSEYEFRKREFNKLSIPRTLDGSKIGALITGLDQTIVFQVSEILKMVANCIEGKIFIYPQTKTEIFNPSDYVKNLQALSEKGVSIAKALMLLITKLNLWEKAYDRLKDKNKHISDAREWGFTKINLSAGGLSFKSAHALEF